MVNILNSLAIIILGIGSIYGANRIKQAEQRIVDLQQRVQTLEKSWLMESKQH